MQICKVTHAPTLSGVSNFKQVSNSEHLHLNFCAVLLYIIEDTGNLHIARVLSSLLLMYCCLSRPEVLLWPIFKFY
jgi:hypothetical protein